MKKKAKINFWSLQHIFATFLGHLNKKAKNSEKKHQRKIDFKVHFAHT